jgi:alpha-glucosidase
MHFHKYPHPSNFQFPGRITADAAFKTGLGRYHLKVRASAEDIYHLQITGPGWERSDSQAELRFPRPVPGMAGTQTSLHFNARGDLQLKSRDGRVLLASLPKRFFGQQGASSLFEFVRTRHDHFYGLGEKWSGLEHSNKTVKFWNTDIWGDFNPESYINGKPAPDPTYVSIPYLIIERGGTYLGLLLDNPYATYISTRFTSSIAGQMETENRTGAIYLCAEKGQPNLYILHGPTLAELTRKLQKLVGPTPLPPAWALGYHQCRWGYQSESDLLGLDRKFRQHQIPVDGLWLDIDYMDGYRIFTFAKKHFPNPRRAAAKLANAGRKIVPIFDPGVKLEKGYRVYDEGRRAGAFCRNRQGGDYVGLVWPGESVFPDFSLKTARDWWAREVSTFADQGFFGAWLDMNDPSTGAAENTDMLFDHGRKEHDAFHNQYALGMARASRAGFLEAHPQERPFLLCRSGSTGISRSTAIWTGDNYSNYHHLKNSIATTLNLALSGVPFNGPDAGGFGGDTFPELIRDWFKAGFLFPILRNHSIIDSRRQEPWAFDAPTLDVLRHYIRLRYRLRPYLYQLFAAQEQTGEAILRPLFYDFPNRAGLPLGLIDDQFLVGPHLLQAPFVVQNQKRREVVLPGKAPWFDTAQGAWVAGNRKITVEAKPLETPLYVRDGSILPLARLDPSDHAFRGERTDFHVYLSGNGSCQTRYLFDDGRSFAYRTGARSEVAIEATRKGGELAIEVRTIHDGYGPGDFTFTTEGAIRGVTIGGMKARRVAAQGIPFGRGRFCTWAVAAPSSRQTTSKRK